MRLTALLRVYQIGIVVFLKHVCYLFTISYGIDFFERFLYNLLFSKS